MKSLWLEKQFPYDGTQLRSLYTYLEHKILGDSIVAWRGACDISFDHMVDGEDLNQKAVIRGGDMLHFIIEKFDMKLNGAVYLQRLFAAHAFDLVREELTKAGKLADTARLRRDGDDIYFEDRKLSISIATVSPVSALVHFAMNVTNENTPVKTISLSDFSIDPTRFAKVLLERFTKEADSADEASMKVKWVK
jgi:uncharacterized protein